MTNFNNITGTYKLAGPFESGFIYSADEFGLLGMNYISNAFTFRYNINGGAWATNWIDIDLDLEVCDTNYVIVDIY